MNQGDKFEKAFNYSIGCIGLLGVLATIIALFITLKNPSVVIRFIEEYSDFPTVTPVDVVLAPKPVPTFTPYPTYTPLPTYTPYPTHTPLPTYTPLWVYITPSTPRTAMPSPTPTFDPSSAIVASVEELDVCEGITQMAGDKNLFIAFNEVNVDTDQVSGILSSPGYPNLEIKNLGVGDRVLYRGKTWYEVRIKEVTLKSVWRNPFGAPCATVIVISFKQ
jgi:hypothetical protein